LSGGRGGLVLLRGEAGAGKSRLAAEVTAEAVRQGVITLWGAAPKHDKRLPYAPFIGALEGLAFRVTPAGLRALLGEAATVLALVVPALAAALGSEQPGWEAELLAPERLSAALAGFFRRLGA